VLTRYDDVVWALRDARLAKEAITSVVAERFGIVNPPTLTRSMLDSDPPDHTRLRGLVSKAFTPRVVEQLRPRVQAIVDDLLARLDGRHGIDLIEDFAYPIPVIVICELLGVPVEDRDRFRAWGLDMARSLDAVLFGPQSDVADRGAAARHALGDYFPRAHQGAPQGPAPGHALRSHRGRGGRRPTDRDRDAGHVHPAPRGGPRDDREPHRQRHARPPAQSWRAPAAARESGLIATAVEELLRYDGPVQRTARVPSEDVKIRDQVIGKGELVMPFIGAADRDPAHFADPDRLDIGRRENRHVAFGYGIHFCLGAPLARVEGQIALGTLVQRLPNLALATDRPQFRMSLTLRGLSSLPVTF
jgi:cytochrome P450